MSRHYIKEIHEIRLNGVRSSEHFPPILTNAFLATGEITKIKIGDLSVDGVRSSYNDKLTLVADRVRHWKFQGRFAVNVHDGHGHYFGRVAGIRLDSDNVVCFYASANCYEKDRFTPHVVPGTKRLSIKGIFIAKHQWWLEKICAELGILEEMKTIITDKEGWTIKAIATPISSERKVYFGI